MIEFNYKEEPGRLHGKTIWRPVANVLLYSTTGEWIEFQPYIDSGADVTLIPLSIGRLIGLKANSTSIKKIGGICGSIPVIYQKILTRFGETKLRIEVAWALIEEVPPLLGRIDVFDYFNVKFKQKEKKIIFEHL